MDKILILDFGSPEASLVGEQIRKLGVYSEIVPGDTPLTDELLGKTNGANTDGGNTGGDIVRGVILSYPPEPARAKEGLAPDKKVHTSGLPVLESRRGDAGDSEREKEKLSAFIFGAARCSPDWTMERYAKEACAAIADKAGTNPVLLLISGGVDSAVAGALLLKTLAPDQVHLMYMDTGLMRKDETKTVQASLESLGAKNLHIIHCEDEFLSALKGVEDPEEKRKIIGDTFIVVQERETARLGLPDSYFLAQGTIYPDIKESGKTASGKASVVKSHHNVGSPMVDAKRRAGRVIEPLDRLFKEEVRELGRLLGLGAGVIGRHPFPGPGIAVRILGEVTREKCEILRSADAIFMEELKSRTGKSGRSLYDEIWQAFPVLLPIRSVGVAGDTRRYGWVLALRAITSHDAMTADVYPFEMKDLLEISARITGAVKDIGRVTYDISCKPPATIEWE